MVAQVANTLREIFGAGRSEARRPEPMSSTAPKASEFEFVYAESIRNLSQQSQVLDSIRSRAGLLIAAASVVTALLAGPTFDVRQGTTLGSLSAIGVFLLSVVLALAIVWPRKGWNFRFGLKDVVDRLESHPETDLAALHRRLAVLNEQSYEDNENKLGRLFSLFRWAAVALVIDVILWLLALTSSSAWGVQF